MSDTVAIILLVVGVAAWVALVAGAWIHFERAEARRLDRHGQ